MYLIVVGAESRNGSATGVEYVHLGTVGQGDVGFAGTQMGDRDS